MKPSAPVTTAAALDRLLRRTRRHVLRWGWARWSAVALPALLAAVWALGGARKPEDAAVWGLAVTWLAGAALLLWRQILAPRRRYADRRRLAAVLEARGRHRNVVRAAEEALRRPERWPQDEPVAAELAARVAREAAGVLEAADPALFEPRRGGRWLAAALAVTAALACAALLAAPSDVARGLRRLAWPAASPDVPAEGGLYAVRSDGLAVAGRAVELAAVDFAGGPGAARCEVRFGQGGWQELAVIQDAARVPMVGGRAPYRLWTATLPAADEDFIWRFRRGTLVTGEVRVPVHHPPLLTGLAATVRPPAYTRLPEQDLQRLPMRSEAPAGSEVILRGAANSPLARADLAFASGDSLAADVSGGDLQAAWTCDATTAFRVHLVDAHGLVNLEPLRYEIVAVPDQEPVATLRREGDDGVLPLAGELELVASAADDYGLTRLELLTRVVEADAPADDEGRAWRGGAFWPGDPASAVPLATAAGTLRVAPERTDDGRGDLAARFTLRVDAQALDLVPGDVLELLVQATDNRAPGEPNRSRSRVLRLTLPSAADVLTAQAESSEQRRGQLEAMRNRSRQLGDDLDRLTRELMKNPVPDWARQKEMETAIERQRTMQEELARVAEELRRELEKLAASQLTTESQLERAGQMSELLAQNPSEGLQQLLDKMESASGQVSPQELTRAMEDVARQQKDMARRLDAALALLKRMAEEQEMAGLVSLLEKMLQKQQELADLSRELAARQEAEEAAAENAGQDQADSEQDPHQNGADQDPAVASQEGEDATRESAGDRDAEQRESAGESADSEASDESSGATQDPAEPTAEELARRQEALEQELAQLMEKLEQALAEMQQQRAEQGEQGQSPSGAQSEMEQALQQALEQLEQQQTGDNMEKASEALQQMDPGQAAQMQEQTLRDLASLYSVLLKSQQAMQSAMQMEQVASLRGLAADMLAVSARQEEIAARIPAGLREVRSLELTRDQHRLQRATENVRSGLNDLMDDAPNRIMRLLEKVDAISEEMGLGVRALEENRAAAARDHTLASLAESNRLVISLLTEAQMSSSSGGGGGGTSSSLSEQLQQMAQEQASLNGATDELRRMLADRGISQEARSQMQRLGEEQAALAQRMGELADQEREQPEGERLLGDLSELGADMESIGREMDDGLVSEETLLRQERILSRMLDARNSVRRRDYSNKRESEEAAELYSRQEGRDGTADDPDRDPLRRRYQPLESAPLEYRDLVRRYFSALDSLRAEAPPLPPRPQPEVTP
jgi:hypothetical protein